MTGDDFMDPDQRRSIKRVLQEAMPYVESSDEEPSRKVRGLDGPGREGRFFKHVNVFVQRGLAEHQDVFREVYQLIGAIQRDNRADEYRIRLYTFGSANREVESADRWTVHSTPSASVLAEATAHYSGHEQADNNCIPDLGQARKDDASVFLCRDRGIEVPADRRLRVHPWKRSLWLFFAGPKVEWEARTFVPAEQS